MSLYSLCELLPSVREDFPHAPFHYEHLSA